MWLDRIRLDEIQDVQLLAPRKGKRTSVSQDPFDLATDDLDPDNVFVIILTAESPDDSGRRFVILCDSTKQREEVSAVMKNLVSKAMKRKEAERNPGILATMQRDLRCFYNMTAVQSAVCLVIVTSYLVTLVETQVMPEPGTEVAQTFYLIELSFTLFFSVEVLIHLLAYFLLPFICDWTNIFDLAIVGVSIVGIVLNDLPNVKVLRLFRVARVLRIVRVFRAITPLRILLTALVNAIVPVLYSFLLLALVISTFAIIATDMFGSINGEKFGDLSKSTFSLFQVLFIRDHLSVVSN